MLVDVSRDGQYMSRVGIECPHGQVKLIGITYDEGEAATQGDCFPICPICNPEYWEEND